MTNPEHDEVFEAYLKRRSVLPNALDDRLEPPAALDEIVLQRAQEAIKAQAGSGATQQTVRAPRWAMPVALAATVLLCLSVVLNISLNTNRPNPNLQRLTAARASVNPGAEADGRGDGRTNNDGEQRESVSGDIPSHEVVLTEAKVAGSPAPRAPVVADSALASAAGTAAAGTSHQPSSADAETAQPPSTEEPRVAARSAADKAALFAKRAHGSSPGSPPSAVGAANAPTSSATAPHPADPKVWLQQIGALRAAGEKDQADAEMRRFRVIFPGYSINPAAPAASEPPK
jgi:hypothetical protein